MDIPKTYNKQKIPENVLLKIMEERKNGVSFNQIVKIPLVHDYFASVTEKQNDTSEEYERRVFFNMKKRFDTQRKLSLENKQSATLPMEDWLAFDLFMQTQYPSSQVIKPMTREVAEALVDAKIQNLNIREVLNNPIISEYYDFLKGDARSKVLVQQMIRRRIVKDIETQMLNGSKGVLSQEYRDKYNEFKGIEPFDIMDQKYDSAFNMEDQVDVEEVFTFTDEFLPKKQRKHIVSEVGDPHSETEEAGLCCLQ